MLYFTGLLARTGTVLLGSTVLRIGLAIVAWWACRFAAGNLASFDLNPDTDSSLAGAFAVTAAVHKADWQEVPGGTKNSDSIAKGRWKFRKSVLIAIAGQ